MARDDIAHRMECFVNEKILVQDSVLAKEEPWRFKLCSLFEPLQYQVKSTLFANCSQMNEILGMAINPLP